MSSGSSEEKVVSATSATPKKKGRKPGEAAGPTIPQTVYNNREVAMGQEPDNEKAQLFGFTFTRTHEGKSVKVSVFTWALTERHAAVNVLKGFHPGSEFKVVTKEEQLKALKRALKAERAAASQQSGQTDKAAATKPVEPAGV